MLRILCRQPLHQWRSLAWRTRIASILVAVLITLFLSGRIYNLFGNLVDGANLMTEAEIIFVSIQTVIVLLSLGTPLVIAWLVPGQQTLALFKTLPLTTSGAVKVIFCFTMKYQIAYLLLLIPLLFTILIYSGLYFFIISLTRFLIFVPALIILHIILFVNVRKPWRFFILTMFLNLLYLTGWTAVLMIFRIVWLPDLISAGVLLTAGLYFRTRIIAGDLENIYPEDRTTFKRRSRVRADSAGSMINSRPLRSMIRKELVSVWRNPRYKRLKWLTLTGYLAGLLLLKTAAAEYAEMWMLLWSGLIIWLHYSNGFSEKYITADPEWYMKTLPLKFYQVWLSRFLAEVAFLMLILLLFTVIISFTPVTFYQIINLFLVVAFFAFFVLGTMVTFRLMFYDDPRLAGYAFHFTVLFITIMSLNDRLVGPLVGIFLLGFYFYKSYRYFKT